MKAPIALLELLLRLAVWLALAPLLPGIIAKVKAWVARRRGPPVLQLYYDLARLWRKGAVISTLASPGFVAGPAVAWVALAAAAALVPLGPLGGAVSEGLLQVQGGDLIVRFQPAVQKIARRLRAGFLRRRGLLLLGANGIQGLPSGE